MSEISSPQPEKIEQESVNVDLFSPEITEALSAATIYAKVERATVRPAIPGEVIESIPSNDHKQTTRTATNDELVLTYHSSGERVIQPLDIFETRWEPTDEAGVFRAKGLSRIIDNPTGRDFITETDWGVQNNKADYLIACVYDPASPDIVSNDRYAIAREVYERTFAPVEAVYGYIPGKE